MIVILIYLAFVLIMFSVLNLCRTSLKTTSVSGAYLLKYYYYYYYIGDTESEDDYGVRLAEASPALRQECSAEKEIAGQGDTGY